MFKEACEAMGSDAKSNSSVRLILHIHVKICIKTRETSPKTKDTLINRMLANFSKVQF
jgi:hypothetical protein